MISEFISNSVSTVLKDVAGCIMFNLNVVQSRLSYWKIKHDGMDTSWNSASLGGYVPPVHISLQGKQSEVAIRVLMKLRHALSVFLSQVLTELETGRDAHDVPLIITRLDTLFNDFSVSVTSIGLAPLAFARLPELDHSVILPDEVILSQIYENLSSIDSYLLTRISQYDKPKSWISGKWGYFALIGAIGISIASKCLMSLSHNNNEFSFLEAVRNFLQEHVKKPIKLIRNEFYARPEKIEDNQVQEASKSLESMLSKFVNQESGENTAEKEIVELVETRVINLCTRPKQSLLNGALIQAILIRVQKMYVDYETGKLEVKKRFCKLNLALVSTIPAYFALKGFIWIADKFWKGILQVMESDRTQSRNLLSTVRIVLTDFLQHPPEPPQQGQYLHGVLLYLLDKFCMRVEKHAKKTAEWDTLKQDVIEVGRFTGERLQKDEAIYRLRKYRCTHA